MTKKILNIVTIAMFVITAIILGLFLFGGDVEGAQYYTPNFTSSLLNWAYVLVVLAILSAMVFPIARLFTRPKQAMKSFIGVGVIIVVVLIAYALSDGTPLQLVGYTGEDNVPSTLKFADTIIFTMYILFGGAFAAIVATEFIRRFR